MTIWLDLKLPRKLRHASAYIFEDLAERSNSGENSYPKCVWNHPMNRRLQRNKKRRKERSQTEYQYSSSFCFLPTVSWNVLFLLIMMTVNSGTMVKNIPTLCPWSYLFSYFAITYKSKQFIIHLLLFLFSWEIASEKSHIKALVFKVVVLRGKIRRPSDHKCLNFIGDTYTLYISKAIWSWALPGRSSSALWQVVSFWFEYYYISFF